MSIAKRRTSDLKAAVATLDLFTQKQADNQDLSVRDGKLILINRSPLKRFLAFMKTIFSRRAREKHLQRKRDVQTTVSGAIDTIRKHHLLISKLHSGDEEEKQLASITIETIKRYNESLSDQSQEENTHLIELPPISHLFSTKENNENLSCAPVLNQEADLIRTKANTLLRQHGLLPTGAALASLNTAPIHAKVNPQSQTSTVCLTLNVLPGTVIQVEGNFKRINDTSSAPIANSFALSVNADQYRFPYPSQHNGWALKGELIPQYIHRLDQVPLFKVIYQRQKELASLLMPQGVLVSHAKKIHALKKAAFLEHRTLLINKHKELVLALLRASELKEDYMSIVEQFFTHLLQATEPLQILEKAYDSIGRSCISVPQDKLQEAWVGKSEKFHDPLLVQESAQEVLLKAYQEQVKTLSPFEQLICRAIGPGTQQILLQHWSETLECAPPMLKDFEQKLQLIAFRQLEIFQSELLDSSPPENCFEGMKKQLEDEIACLNANSFEGIESSAVDIVYELEAYFNTRYLGKALLQNSSSPGQKVEFMQDVKAE